MQLKPGMKLRSAVCTTEVMVVRAPTGSVDVACGGAPMLPDGVEPDAGAHLDPAHATGTLMGKRYADDDIGIEMLCIRPGEGSLSCGGEALHPKGAKPLPSSD